MAAPSEPSAPSPKDLPVALALGLVAVAAAAIALRGMLRPLWLDEAYSVLIARHDIATLWDDVRNDSGPPLYYLLLSGWMQLLGSTELAVRGLSFLFHVGAALTLYSLARERFSRRAGVLAAVLYGFCQTAIDHAHNARMYALLVLCTALSTRFFLRIAHGDRSNRAALFYAFTTALGTFSHYWFFFVLGAQGVATLIWYRAAIGRLLVVGIVAVIPFALLWSPALRFQLQRNASAWIDKPDWRDLVLTFADYYGGYGGLMAGGLVFAGVAVLVLGPGTGPVRARPRQLVGFLARPDIGTLLVLIIFTTAVPWLVSQKTPMYVVGRYTVVGIVPLALLIAALLDRFAERRLIWIAGAFFVASMLLVNLRLKPKAFDEREAATRIAERIGPGDAVVFTSLSRMAVEYYLDRLVPEHHLFMRSFPAEIDRHPGWRNVPSLTGAGSTLTNEADALLRAAIASGAKRLWLLYGFKEDDVVSDVFKRRIDTDFMVVDSLPAPGVFYSVVLVYDLERPRR